MKATIRGLAGLVALGALLFPFAARAEDGWRRGDQGWYIGFGVGTGSGRVANDGDTATESGGTLASFKIGAVLNDNFLLGAELAGWRKEEGDTAVQFSHMDAVATWFPSATLGGYLKAGAGFGVPSVEVDGETENGDTGFDLRFGLGWEFRLGQSFHLGVEVVTAATTQEDVDYVGDTGVLLTFGWY